MGSVYRHTYTCTRGGQRVTKQTKKWYLEFVDPRTGERVRQAGYEDYQATQALLVRLESEAAQVAAGFLPAGIDRARVKLADHLDDYLDLLRAKNNGADYVALVKARSEAILSGCGFHRWADLDHGRLTQFLAGLRVKAPSRKGGLSIRTTNHYLTQFRGFVGWLSRKMKAVDPLQECAPLNPETDRRHVRRALADQEFAALLAAAHGSPARHYFLLGEQRAMLYLTAAYTGLRASELASLTPESFQLDSSPPTVTVEAGYSKRRRLDLVPVPATVLAQLRPWLASRKPGVSLWPGDWADDRHAAAMLRRDLKPAGIPYRDAAGRVFDFHALRGQYGTCLARAGVPLVEAQRLMRHSTPNLTSNYYTHLELRDLGASADRLKTDVQLGELGGQLGGGQAESGPPRPDQADKPKRRRA